MVAVTCVDGVVRHAPFATMSEAAEWAEWGHCCVRGHTFAVVAAGERRPVR
jgi:hypothetical protein